MSKKYFSQRYQDNPNLKVFRLERVIQDIKEEANLRNNIRILINTSNRCSEEMEKIKMLNKKEIDLLKSKKEKLTEELAILETCITSNIRILEVKMKKCEDTYRQRKKQKKVNKGDGRQRKHQKMVNKGDGLDGIYWVNTNKNVKRMRKIKK